MIDLVKTRRKWREDVETYTHLIKLIDRLINKLRAKFKKLKKLI